MDDGAVPGLRERKKRETRDALSWAVIRLSVERGWENVSVEDAAAAANVSVRTFRNYFSGKAEAVVSRHAERMLRFADELRGRPADEPLEQAVKNATLARLGPPPEATVDRAPSREWTDGVRLMLAEPDVQGEFLKAMASAQAEMAAVVAERTGTDVARDLYPSLVAAATGAAVSTAMEHWLRADPPVPFGPLVREALDRLWAGLPVP
ncbi:TetR family transcriptional regulator [Streptosporangium sp. DT93]|uniref:acyl-CoA-like ligand-binding transcription factor n=1 Tax=Streptosporangium sp. DT93 TaxID=3393428 RepID=UPI003CF1FA18